MDRNMGALDREETDWGHWAAGICVEEVDMANTALGRKGGGWARVLAWSSGPWRESNT